MASENDDWGDEEIDQILLETAEEEEKQRLNNLKDGSVEMSAPTNASNASNFNHCLATQAYDFRRDSLVEEPRSKSKSGESISTFENASCDPQSQGLSSKKEMELKDLAQRALGESAMLRKQLKKLQEETTAKTITDIQKGNEMKLKHSKEVQELNKKIRELQTLSRNMQDEISDLKTKPTTATPGSTGLVTTVGKYKLSVGGAGAGLQKSFVSTTSVNMNSPKPGPSTKFRSNPSLISQVPSPPPVERPKVKVAERSTQTQVDKIEETKKRDNLIFSHQKINVGELESVALLKLTSKRQEIFCKLESLIHLEYEEVDLVLEKVVSSAPQEIMTSFVGGPEIRTSFPDVIDCMFQCGIQQERPNINVEHPKLPWKYGPGIVDVKPALRTVQNLFIYESAWGALRELKAVLKKLLEGLYGDDRNRLFERENLRTLWKILAWANHLWKFIVFEEEVGDLMKQQQDKDAYIQELVSWTGIILKVDWRDLYVPKLERIVRGLSLGILESIMTSGYFEENQRRYEILYCVIKDTLIKDYLRKDYMIRRCLAILTWAIANKNILNYMCLENEEETGNCLAQLLGDYVLKCFKETKNPYRSAYLLISYLNLLEALLTKQPLYRHFSKIAKSKEKKNSSNCLSDSSDESDEECMEVEEAPEDEHVEAEEELLFEPQSQFACPNKYKFEEGVEERAKRFNKVKKVSCWINPTEWELPFEFKGTGPCQCRKALLGSIFKMACGVLNFWKDAYMKHLKAVEEKEISDMVKVQTETSALAMPGCDPVLPEAVQHLSIKVKSLRDFILKEMENCETGEVNPFSEREYTWEKLLKRLRTSDQIMSEKIKEEIEADVKRPENVFDYILRRSVLFINFCRYYSQNLALAIGTEGFNCLNLLECYLKFYEEEIALTDLEKEILSEFDVDDIDDENEKKKRDEATATIDIQLDDFNVYDVFEEEIEDYYNGDLIPDFIPDLILEGLPD